MVYKIAALFCIIVLVRIYGSDTLSIAQDENSPVDANSVTTATSSEHAMLFDPNGGSGAVERQFFLAGHLISLKPNTFIRTGHTFTGWNTDPDGRGEHYDDGELFVMGDDDKELYAQWRANSYSICLDLQKGGASEPEKIIVTYGQPFGSVFPEVSYEGNEFGGWYTEKNGGGEEIVSPMVVDITEDICLYALWTAVEYTIDYELNGGDNHPDNPRLFTVETPQIKLNHPEKTGYTFDGWFLDVSFTKPVSSVESGSIGDLTLFAKWDINQYTVSFKSNGGDTVPSQTVTYGHEALKPDQPSRAGYTFRGWYSEETSSQSWNFDSDMVTDDMELHARWQPVVNTITFDPAEGTGVMDPQLLPTDQSQVLAANAFSRTGYAFAGWSSAPESSGVFYDDQALFTMGTEDITLFARWEAEHYTVSFDHQGGIATQPPKATVTFDKTYEFLPQTDRDGYQFKGWYTEQSGQGRKITAETLVTDTADYTLFVHWEITDYRIDYELYEGNNHNDNLGSYTVEDSDLVLLEPAKEGYTFESWFADSLFSEPMLQIDSGSTGDRTLFAKWLINEYAVMFESNGGEEIRYQTIRYGENASEPQAPRRAGYLFKGWYGDKSLKQQWDFDKEPIKAVTTLYAKWEAVENTITFRSNGGRGTMEAQIIPTDLTAQLIPNTYTRTGYTFRGWNTMPDGCGDFYEEKASFTMGVRDNELFSQWKSNGYIVNFDPRQGSAPQPPECTVTFHDKYGCLAHTERKGYEFRGWYGTKEREETFVGANDTVVIADDHTLYASWEIIEYSIEYVLDQGDSYPDNPDVYTVESADIVLLDPERYGYTFAGWFTDHSFSDELKGVSSGSVGNRIFYAKWEIKEYVVSFEPEGGSLVDSLIIEHGSRIPEPSAPLRAGYEFKGWYQDSLTTSPWHFEHHSVIADTTLYARWEAVLNTITFDPSGGSGTMDLQRIPTDGVGDLHANNFTRRGYTFTGWNTKTDGRGVYYPDEAQFSMSPDSVTLFAQWNANEYAVVFDPQNGSTPEPESTLVTFDRPYGTLAKTDREGYEFEGWFTEKNGKGTEITPQTIVNITETLKLYASWSSVQYSIRYVLYGGENHEDNPESFTIESSDIELKPPQREGYTFNGWYSDSLTTDTVSVIRRGTTGDVTLHAGWTINVYTIEFDSRGGSKIESLRAEFKSLIPEPEMPVKPGFTFINWYEDSLHTQLWRFEQDLVKYNLVLYAQWYENLTYSITYDANIATSGNPPIDSSSYEEGDSIEVAGPKDLLRNGYAFSGWNSSAEGDGESFAQGDYLIMGEEYITLYARWSANDYKVYFDKNDSQAKSAMEPQIIACDSTTILKSSEFEKEGWRFRGWALRPDGNLEFTDGARFTMGAEDQTLYALWRVNEYTITFNKNDSLADGVMEPQKMTFGDSAYLDSCSFAKEGWAFIGWAETYDGEVVYAQGDVFSVGTTDTTLYARWELIEYRISYRLSGGVNHRDNPNVYTIDSPTISLHAPQRDDFLFEGWFADSAFTLLTKEIGSGSAGVVTLHAKWAWTETDFTDADGNVYQTVQINNQVWLTQNLRTTRYADGSPITLITDNIEWADDTAGAYCLYRNTTDKDSAVLFGALYNWHAVSSERFVSDGWRVPTERDWEMMIQYLVSGGYNWDRTTTGNRVAKAVSAKNGWKESVSAGAVGNNPYKNNTTGFSARPGGYRFFDGGYFFFGDFGKWWSDTESDNSNAYYYYLFYDTDGFFKDNLGKNLGMSVRLVKDVN